jgi:alkanesulfonate monooxygenase SsuD/methylene tetrahydromethanopterin reductase-like flavin-dependent oxidoreductase (luciferase family)
MTTIQIKYELRTPDQFNINAPDYYAEALKQMEWADKRNCFDRINFSEHHGSEDGYLPSPVVLMASAAARTERIRLQSNIILPFHDPIRIAEDVAVADIISNGRTEVVVVGGYVIPEFAMFGVELQDRGKLIEAGVKAIRNAWRGETFEFNGRTVKVSPLPVQQPGPPIYMGGGVPAAARRAARIADGFLPMVPEAYVDYEQECIKLNKQPVHVGKIEAVFVHISNDPDRDWARIAPHALDQSNMYVKWQSQTNANGIFEPVTDAKMLRSSGTFAVVTPDECLEMIERLGDDGLISLDPLMGGMPVELGWESLELFASAVAPRMGDG